MHPEENAMLSRRHPNSDMLELLGLSSEPSYCSTHCSTHCNIKAALFSFRTNVQVYKDIGWFKLALARWVSIFLFPHYRRLRHPLLIPATRVESQIADIDRSGYVESGNTHDTTRAHA